MQTEFSSTYAFLQKSFYFKNHLTHGLEIEKVYVFHDIL